MDTITHRLGPMDERLLYYTLVNTKLDIIQQGIYTVKKKKRKKRRNQNSKWEGWRRILEWFITMYYG